jgi:CO dehydrogenase nickel-insertion accessory protein CooC1
MRKMILNFFGINMSIDLIEKLIEKSAEYIKLREKMTKIWYEIDQFRNYINVIPEDRIEYVLDAIHHRIEVTDRRHCYIYVDDKIIEIDPEKRKLSRETRKILKKYEKKIRDMLKELEEKIEKMKRFITLYELIEK